MGKFVGAIEWPVCMDRLDIIISQWWWQVRVVVKFSCSTTTMLSGKSKLITRRLIVYNNGYKSHVNLAHSINYSGCRQDRLSPCNRLAALCVSAAMLSYIP